MKKNYALVAITIIFSLALQAQTTKREIDLGNVREGESVEYCITHKKMAKLLSDPVKYQEYQQILAQQEAEAKLKKPSTQKSGAIYTIPVVFHVLHNGGPENLSREQILDALSILNRDYARLNADANNVQAPFQGMPADIQVQFVLATKDPSGQCFSGITRTKNSITSDGEDGDAQVDAIVAGNDVYNGNWPGNKYLNIFICQEIGGAAGYTFNPWSSSMYAGIWVLSDYVGSIGTSSVSSSRTLTHEVGHWLNLSHTWGPNNNPGNTSSCSDDDGVQDTPLCIGVSSCNYNSNTCNDIPSSFSSWSTDVVDNVENYMDYSYCSKMFTEGQKDRMHDALNSSVAGRNNLSTTQNLTATGADGNLNLCAAQFSADKTVICVGESVTLSDATYNVATGWNWTTTGGSPASSSSQNPVITYTTPGLYTVSLTASGGGNSDTETKTQYIRVLPASSALPLTEGFESYSTLNNLTNWMVYDQEGGRPFSLYTGTGYTGTKCVRLNNFSETASTSLDELESAPIDLSTLSSSDEVTLTFRYSYKKKSSANSESLKILATKDCGETWTVRKTFAGSSFGTLVSTSNWTPSTQADWTTVHVTAITSAYFVSNFRFKFQFLGSGGNNIFIDDINLYKGSAGTLGIENTASSLSDFSMYPNPTDAELNVEFSVENNTDVLVNVKDITGKTAQKHLIKAVAGSNLVLLNTAELSSGLYFLNIEANGTQKTMQFVVK